MISRREGSGSMLKAAIDFVTQYYKETKQAETSLQERINQITTEIEETGFYVQTTDELTYGAKLAWRNSNKCIGRLFWNGLHLFDHRHLVKEEDIFEALLEHIRYATNKGKIRPTISVFNNNRVRIWNEQLIRYAGYEIEGHIVGDPLSVEFTKQCEQLGFKGNHGEYDLLPLVIQVDGQMPKMFYLPEKEILQVSITHSSFKWFEELNLQWYAVPIISNMAFEIGGVIYKAAPFNGWYMGTEIGARNLADEARYNKLPIIAENLGLDISKANTLWQDRALIELNYAVLESFKNKGISIVDHHTAAQQFKLFEEQEAKAERDVTGNWVWLVPPMAPATTHIFHKSYSNKKKSPNYIYQKCPFHEKN